MSTLRWSAQTVTVRPAIAWCSEIVWRPERMFRLPLGGTRASYSTAPLSGGGVGAGSMTVAANAGDSDESVRVLG
jgi:hypothetical protein